MKQTNKFENLLELLKNKPDFKEKSIQSLNWYRRKVASLYKNVEIKPKNVYSKQNIQKNLPITGSIVTFKYDPEYKGELPYYDIYPLVLLLSPIAGKTFTGINFHYLHPIDRAYFMQHLQEYAGLESNTDQLVINIGTNLLKSSNKFKFYKSCIKKYRIANIRNKIYTLKPEEWDIALFLPTEKFVKEDKRKVWENSRKNI